MSGIARKSLLILLMRMSTKCKCELLHWWSCQSYWYHVEYMKGNVFAQKWFIYHCIKSYMLSCKSGRWEIQTINGFQFTLVKAEYNLLSGDCLELKTNRCQAYQRHHMLELEEQISSPNLNAAYMYQMSVSGPLQMNIFLYRFLQKLMHMIYQYNLPHLDDVNHRKIV